MKKDKKWETLIMLLCVMLGFMMAVQLKSVVNTGGNIGQNERFETLQMKYNEERDKTEALRGQVSQYKEELDRFRDEASASGSYANYLNNELKRAEVLAGLTNVAGPGLRITLKDGISIIHDGDLLLIVNELRDAGAEALSFNGQRILSTSEIRCAGSVVSVNNVRLAAPFEICAIGDAQTMYDALYMHGGVVDTLSQWGIEIGVEKLDKLTIKGYEGAIEFKYALPAEEAY